MLGVRAGFPADRLRRGNDGVEARAPTWSTASCSAGTQKSKLVHLYGAQLTAALGLKSRSLCTYMEHSLLQRLRYGKQFVQGPPGTGKTYYAKEITKPFLLDDSKVHQGIICSTTNEGVDELALGMQQLVEEVMPEGQTKRDGHPIPQLIH